MSETLRESTLSIPQQHLQATLKHSHESTASIQRAIAVQEELRTRHERPHDHLDGDPNVGSDPLADQLRGQFGTQERNAVKSRGGVEVIRVHANIVEEVVRVCLLDISA
jgi:hypothetical protein